MKKTGLLCLVLLTSFLASAQNGTLVQDLEEEETGKGRVTVEMDSRLDSLLGPKCAALSGESVKATGYRIQIYSGNNTRTAKENAGQAEKYIQENYPQLPVYTIFKSPRWTCVVGDFLYFEEAYETMRLLRRSKAQFKQMIILRNQEINVPI
ncbi:MAG: SPOR domain-containing protein [Bacteroidaceae bacterium]|nr:SPOR domain-containing protein [Bacteroidaceae bacterium]